MGWKCENVHLSRSSNSNFYKTTGLNSSGKISVKIILSKFGSLLKLIWFKQSSLRPVDGKYCSATAPLALWFNFKLLLNHVTRYMTGHEAHVQLSNTLMNFIPFLRVSRKLSFHVLEHQVEYHGTWQRLQA